MPEFAPRPHAPAAAAAELPCKSIGTLVHVTAKNQLELASKAP